jgi:cell envelope opacity-associated protein A
MHKRLTKTPQASPMFKTPHQKHQKNQNTFKTTTTHQAPKNIQKTQKSKKHKTHQKSRAQTTNPNNHKTKTTKNGRALGRIFPLHILQPLRKPRSKNRTNRSSANQQPSPDIHRRNQQVKEKHI